MLNKLSVGLLLCCLLFFVAACAPEAPTAPAEPTLDTPKNRISYTIGLNIGKDFATQEMDVDPDVLIVGIKDAMAGKEPRLSEEEMVAEIQTFQQKMQEQQLAKVQVLADKNKAEGEAFLTENIKKEGVVVLESGLQYKVVEPGDGASPTADSVVTVHYRGTLVDGTEFDSSYGRGEPATFPVGGVIPGWSEALPLMKVGAKWQLFVPAELAYGERGAGQAIGPNSVLIFDVELIKIETE